MILQLTLPICQALDTDLGTPHLPIKRRLIYPLTHQLKDIGVIIFLILETRRLEPISKVNFPKSTQTVSGRVRIET